MAAKIPNHGQLTVSMLTQVHLAVVVAALLAALLDLKMEQIRRQAADLAALMVELTAMERTRVQTVVEAAMDLQLVETALVTPAAAVEQTQILKIRTALLNSYRMMNQLNKSNCRLVTP